MEIWKLFGSDGGEDYRRFLFWLQNPFLGTRATNVSPVIQIIVLKICIPPTDICADTSDNQVSKVCVCKIEADPVVLDAVHQDCCLVIPLFCCSFH